MKVVPSKAMKSVPLLSAVVLVATLAGCAIVPAEPAYGYGGYGGYGYAAPPPSAVVVVRPSYGYYGHGYYGGPRYRHWR
jgi:hypothetical protein